MTQFHDFILSFIAKFDIKYYIDIMISDKTSVLFYQWYIKLYLSTAVNKFKYVVMNVLGHNRNWFINIFVYF